MNDLERRQLLRHTPEFAACSEDGLRRVSTLVDEVCLPGGTVVAEQGTLCHAFVIVASGVLETCRSGQAGYLHRADTFGWTAMQERGVHDATVSTATPARLLVMSHRQFQTAVAIAADGSRRFAGLLPFAGPPSPAGPSPTGAPVGSVGTQRTHANSGC